MTKLISTKQVRDRLSLQDDEGINTAIRSAMTSAEVRMSAILSTTLTYGTSEDLFYVEEGMELRVANNYILRLKKGFIKTTPAPIVYVGDSLASLLPVVGITPVAPLIIDYEKGFILLDKLVVTGKYVRVDYHYGFDSLSVIPDWVQEVMIGFTAKVLSSQQIADGKPELSNVFSFLDNQSEVILVPKMRSRSAAIMPIL